MIMTIRPRRRETNRPGHHNSLLAGVNQASSSAHLRGNSPEGMWEWTGAALWVDQYLRQVG